LLREWCGVTPLLEEAATFYGMQLSRHREAVGYLQQRGLHAPASWAMRCRHCARQGL
jgi:hypothetical protein